MTRMNSTEEKIAELTLNPKTKKVEKLKLHQSNIRFKCQRCATFCCRLGGPGLSEKDIQRLKQARPNTSEFLDAYSNLRNNEDGSCVLLKFDVKNNVYECSVYDFRPTLCRLYPFRFEKLSRSSYTLKLIPCCNGLNKEDGELVNENFIADHLLDALLDLNAKAY